MNVSVYPSKVSGILTAPPSKSISHRAIIIASLANGPSTLENVLLSNDTRYTIDALRALGVRIEENGSRLTIKGTDGVLHAPKSEIYVGNSGTTMRTITAVAALAPGRTVLTGDNRLCERPMKDLLNALFALGIEAKSLRNNNCPPIEIKGGAIVLQKVTISGNISSQYVTALLLIAPFSRSEVTIDVQNLKSKPYVAVTIDVMKAFGVDVKNDNFETFVIPSVQMYRGRNYTIEGDYSSASYFFAASAITGGEVTVKNLNPNSSQGDANFVQILKQMGCLVKKRNNAITVKGLKELRAVDVDMGDYPDIVQTLTIVAAFAQGTTHIRNIGHLKYKEIDRIEKPALELAKMGINTDVSENELTIYGAEPRGATIDTHNDHRMAMSFAVAGLGAQGKTIITNAQVVAKSYPNFFNDLKRIGADVEELP